VGVLLGGVACDSSQLADDIIIDLYQCVPTALFLIDLVFYRLNRNPNDPLVYRFILSASCDTTTWFGLPGAPGMAAAPAF
jgi:hypothetical protein